MRALSVTLLIAVLVICFLTFKENLIILESLPLNGTVSVYYDSNENKYIYIKGYTKKNGTIIKGYYRSLPDKDKSNNWSTKGNINPFTGKKGHGKI